MSGAAEEGSFGSSVSSLSAVEQPVSSSAAVPLSGTQTKGGGVFDYLISRKRKKINHNNNSTTTPPSSPDRKSDGRMKYHRLANAAGSQYFGSLSMPLFNDDSDSDKTIIPKWPQRSPLLHRHVMMVYR